MADKIIVKIDLEKGDTSKATKGIQSDMTRAGAVSGAAFGKTFGAGVSKSLTSIGTILRNNIGLITAFAGVFGGRAILQAAAKQEDAVNALNAALKITKNAGIGASEGIQAFASELQQSTRFGDEVLLQNAALIQSLGDLDEQGLKRALRATTDLATALRIDLGTAATLVGKAAAGEVGSFSRYGLSIQKAGSNAETFTKALDAIEKKFGGAAQLDVNTFSGRVDQLGNAFGDLLEKIGGTVTGSDFFLKVINGLTGIIQSAINNFDTFIEIIKSLTVGILDFASAITTTVLPVAELLYNGFALAFNGITQLFFEVINGIAQGVESFSGILSSIGIDVSGLQTATEGGRALLGEQAAGGLDFTASAAINDQIEALRASLNNRNEVVAEANERLVAGQIDTTEKVTEATKEMVDKNGQLIGGALVNVAVEGFSRLGASLVQGASAFENFGVVVANLIGDLAINLGKALIAKGLAIDALRTALSTLTGGVAIAAGAGLIALGGALKSLGGGLVSATTGAGSVAEATSPEGSSFTPVAEPEQIAERQTRVNINVEGSLVRQEELGDFISSVLSESNAKNSNIITDFRTA